MILRRGTVILLVIAVSSATAATPPAAPRDGAARSTPDERAMGAPHRRSGERFHDTLSSGGRGPELVVVPAGRFAIGSPDFEQGRQANEGPQRELDIASFALGRTEISRGEFAAFVRATRYRTDAERNTSLPGETGIDGCYVADGIKGKWKAGTSWRNASFLQDDTHPVVCVSWNDATAYVEWLRRQTGLPYRLPSEAELEYANRAGSDHPWPWGPDPDGGCVTANGADEFAEDAVGLVTGVFFAASNCNDGYAQTAPVGRLGANAFGLHDTSGNVSEWAQDCAERNYAAMPDDGRAHEVAGCASRVNRGACFTDEPVWMRAAIRLSLWASHRYFNLGFRVARTLQAVQK